MKQKLLKVFSLDNMLKWGWVPPAILIASVYISVAGDLAAVTTA